MNKKTTKTQLGFWKIRRVADKKPIMALAPMSGVTDQAFRQILLKYGRPDVFWTEFVSADGLLSKRGRAYCLKILEFLPKEKPIVAQVFGGDPASFEKASAIIAELGFDGIDINMGCPDKDIEKKGGGASLIKNPELAVEIIRATKKGAGKIPVSVKTRIGYDKNEISEWIPTLLKEKIAVLTVHFRTREQMYLSKANWDLAKEIVKLRNIYSPETLIFGNGDVKTLEEAKKLATETGIDGVMIGRGVLANPWFFSGKIPTIEERLKAIVEHAEILEKLNEKNFDSIKKYFHSYTKGFRGARELRDNLMKAKNLAQTKKIIAEFRIEC